MIIVNGKVHGIIPVYVNVTDLNEFFHAEHDSMIFYYLEEDHNGTGSCLKEDLTVTSIQFPIK